MKKILAFLALLATGLGVLWLLQRAEEEEKAEPIPEVEPAPEPPPLPPGVTPTQGMTPTGSLRMQQYLRGDGQARPVLLRVEVTSSGRDPEDEKALVAAGATLEYFDVDTNEPLTEIQAEVLRIRDVADSGSLVPELQKVLHLEGVVLTLLDGAPVVPLTLRTATLEVDLEERTMRTADPITIEGANLDAEGIGLWVDEADGVLEIQRDGVVRFDREDGGQGTLSATEELVIRRVEGPEGTPVLIDARGGERGQARLEPSGEEAELVADRIGIRGAETAARDEPFRLDQLDAEGDVFYRLGPHSFRSGRAHVEFLPDGTPLDARLEDDPSATLALSPTEQAIPGAPEDETLDVRVSGKGPLVVNFEQGMVMRLGGPGRIEAAGAELRSDGAVTAWANEAGSEARIEAKGGVTLARDGTEGEGEGVLTTETLEATIQRDPEGLARVDATSTGQPLLTGTSRDGRRYELRSTRSLSYSQVEDTWTIPEARGVELVVFGDDGFRAKADEVRDFDPETMHLEARGNIEFESASGNGRGESLSMRGRESFLLTGTPERKATFVGDLGRVEAVAVDRDGEVIDLSGGVVAHIVAGTGDTTTYDLSSDHARLTRSETVDEDAGTRRVRSRLQADGGVEATVSSAIESVQLSAASLDGTRTETLGADDTVRRAESTLAATAVTEARLSRGPELAVRLSCNELEAGRVEEDGVVVEGVARASGEVVFHGQWDETPFNGTAHALSIDHLDRVRADGRGGERVFVSGVLPSNGRPFEMEAAWVTATTEEVRAGAPDVQVKSMGEGAELELVDIRASANSLVSTRSSLELTGDVHVTGLTDGTIPWVLDAQSVLFEGEAERPDEGGEIRAMTASGSVRLSLSGRQASATGAELRARALSGVMRLSGDEDVPAQVHTALARIEAEWIELDVDLGFVVGSGSGRIVPVDPEVSGEWEIEYLSSRTLIDPDTLIYVLQEPRLDYPSQGIFPFLPADELTVASSWTVIWINRHTWGGLPQRMADDEVDLESFLAGLTADDMGTGEQGDLARRLRDIGVNEIYLEGPVEAFYDGQPNAHADAVYFDVIDGHGWLANASFTLRASVFGRDPLKLKVKADWLRRSTDGSLHADDATVTPCDHADPHLSIQSGSFRIDPRIDANGEPDGFDFSLEDNRIAFGETLNVPVMPSINFSTDEEYQPDFASVEIGDSARFGTFFSAGISRPADSVGKAFHELVGGVNPDFRAEYNVDLSYLGSRGLLLDLGLDLESKEEYWWHMNLGGIPDDARDRGIIRVPASQRDDLRLWYRTRGRYFIDEQEWIDVAGSIQSDAAVQSEFFEQEFQYYEQSENFVHWRQARNEYYFDATAKKRFDSFRTDIEELPSIGGMRGRSQLADLGFAPLVYTADVRADYLQRRQGDPDLASPYGPVTPFLDGLGDREVMRFDTTHRFETPISLGVAGLRMTPFALGRFTAWDEDQLQARTPLRGLGQAGVRLSTTLWKAAGERGLHQIVPYLEGRSDFVHETSGGLPVSFDQVELPLEGSFFDVGVRSRWGLKDGVSVLDLDLRGTYAGGVPGQRDGWRNSGVFGLVNFEPFGMPLQLFHDGRYDIEQSDTLYSLTSAGIRVTPKLALRGAHHRARDRDRDELYEAASVGALYTWTEKWEFEGLQIFSLTEDGGDLGYNVTLRRYGHDLVFELDTSFVQGEGASIGISVRPLLTWNRRDPAYPGF